MRFLVGRTGLPVTESPYRRGQPDENKNYRNSLGKLLGIGSMLKMPLGFREKDQHGLFPQQLSMRRHGLRWTNS
jgi:hypothetical protein